MKILPVLVWVLIFTLAGVLFFQSFTSVNADIGRHLKLGEIIWQTKSVPAVNLFSFTAPDFPFINHHWLSEVVFYGVYLLGGNWLDGLRAMIVFKTMVLLAAYGLLFLFIRRHHLLAGGISFLFSIAVFAARTEPRPEIFSYLILAAYLLLLYKNRIRSYELRIKDFKINSLWLLPVLQILWVNLHIYFIIGPIIFLFFLIDESANQRRKLKIENLIENWKLKIIVFLMVILANLINPNFIKGALYPFTVFKEYGYSVAENSSLFFLADYFGRWAPQDKLFLVLLLAVIISFVLNFWRVRRTGSWLRLKFFDLALMLTMAVLSFKMQRNIPLFALSSWPVLAGNLSPLFKSNRLKLIHLLNGGLVFVLALGIYLTANGWFYNQLDSAKVFGWHISKAAQEGTDFVKGHKIAGPVFNNFDIGSYLVWQLYPIRTNGFQADPTSNGTSPEYRVFIDGRPEAYPVEFFEKIYKPMQREEKVWQTLSEQYGINYIFFAHTDMTEWAEDFLTRIAKDPKWPLVFLNEAVVIFLKDNPINQTVIEQFKISDQNIKEKTEQVLAGLDPRDDNAFINFGNALYRLRWLKEAVQVFETLIANQPSNPYGYQGAGYAYAAMNEPATQAQAAQNLQKAVDLGFKTFNNYFTLGMINANLGNFFQAQTNLEKALRLKPDHQNALQVLTIVKKRLGDNLKELSRP